MLTEAYGYSYPKQCSVESLRLLSEYLLVRIQDVRYRQINCNHGIGYDYTEFDDTGYQLASAMELRHTI